MKTILSLLAVLSLSWTTWAQDIETDSDLKKLETRELPEIVIKQAGEDFSVYLPEFENEDAKIKTLQKAFVAYNLGTDYEGYENYMVTLEQKDATLIASYNSKGKLTNVVEKYTDVKLPMAVIYGVYKNFPGWTIEKDQYLYSQSNGEVTKKEYKLKLTKDKKTKRIIVASSGAILKS